MVLKEKKKLSTVENRNFNFESAGTRKNKLRRNTTVFIARSLQMREQDLLRAN